MKYVPRRRLSPLAPSSSREKLFIYSVYVPRTRAHARIFNFILKALRERKIKENPAIRECRLRGEKGKGTKMSQKRLLIFPRVA